jgi:hypothetical protein
MTEFGVDLRAAQAEQFRGQRLLQYSDAYRDYDLGDFIATGIRDRTAATPLNEEIAEGTDTTDMPVAWRFVVPAPQRSTAALVEFGTSVPGVITGDKARFSNEMHIDTDINNHADHPAVQELFLRLGGDLVNLIKRDDGIIFSGIERMARLNPDGTGSIWNRLVYSEKLLMTGKLLDRHIDVQRSQGVAVAEWLHTAALAKNRRSTAAAMALSGLHAFRVEERA